MTETRDIHDKDPREESFEGKFKGRISDKDFLVRFCQQSCSPGSSF